MQGKYDESPIYKLYTLLDKELTKKYTCNMQIDKILKYILLNNGCKINEGYAQYQCIENIIPDEYSICFINGIIGNDVNEYYDFITFNGMKYLIVFKDYFKDISYGTYNSQDPMLDLKIAMGNSVYYDAIKKIVEVFYLTSEPVPNGLLTTAMAATQRWNQAIIAIHILNQFKPVDENDIPDIPMDDINKILDGNITLQLYGIRTM